MSNLTPKEKAKQLVDNYLNELNQIDSLLLLSQKTFTAKQCALICVDETIDAFNRLEDYVSIVYWELVKKEIELL